MSELRRIVLVRLGMLRTDPTIAELLAAVERERLREQGVRVFVAREASA